MTKLEELLREWTHTRMLLNDALKTEEIAACAYEAELKEKK